MSEPAGGGLPERRLLLHGLGITNAAVARAAVAHGLEVVLSDDGRPALAGALGDELGAPVVLEPSAGALEDLVRSVDAVVPAPGLPEHHPLFVLAAAHGRPVLSEFDLAAAWDDRPVLAITGTNGKTTVTTLVTAMLERSGRRAAAVGNLDTPLVEAIARDDLDVFVVEASSFRLAHSRRFAPLVGTWLNFAPDHLDVHRTLDDYRMAKARIWRDQGAGDTAVAAAEDPVVDAAIVARTQVAAAEDVPGPAVLRFGLAPVEGGRAVEYHQDGSLLVGPARPGGEPVELVDVADMWRALPHDRTNALAAAATALAGGATVEGVRAALRDFRGLPHRVELVGERDDVRWYDDSKATAPHATLAALRGFDSVVLVAGGRNKGLDLGELHLGADHVRAVVGIGESGAEVLAAFPDRPGRLATSMAEAVASAAELAEGGDVVLLSPGCASFDWYGSYSERGDDFAARVRELVLAGDGGAA
ncbi:UDP-N-acetylmuramoyl-L-alanine--D-glutamate ligase [Dermatobacter hominis]|uniref:UDP-N-acetylmuramoyl-L-alanine--D-glutamate ligase n=1 Tax=Dermatobacter hominis TaxID=2884263 RepID=UPI001D1027B9|nr:UDP-N-acetylmuramoyl-L-alanine--D-glutamate ligase [Dermatobacter hominis]UDY35975.1 UDP-N-acetylmuramoyl-L-alanine--D-glutamate ligase [Dermatobacter hominis]